MTDIEKQILKILRGRKPVHALTVIKVINPSEDYYDMSFNLDTADRGLRTIIKSLRLQGYLIAGNYKYGYTLCKDEPEFDEKDSRTRGALSILKSNRLMKRRFRDKREPMLRREK